MKHSTENQNCKICGNQTAELLTFPNFPRGGVFIDSDKTQEFSEGEELLLMVCNDCGHIQLGNTYDLNFYNDDYSYRTPQNLSENSSADLTQIYKELEGLVQENKIKTVLEFGANNLSFLMNFEYEGKKIAVDPLLKHIKDQNTKIEMLPFLAEEIEENLMKEVNLFVSRHNLEHIEDPARVLKRISSLASNKDKKFFFVEVPDLDNLILNNRIDHIFLEHLHYFNLHTLKLLFNNSGFKLIKSWKNNRYCGSVCAIFESEGPQKLETQSIKNNSGEKLLLSFNIFKTKCEKLRQFMETNYGNCYGYGAGHSTPFLAYHIDGRFHLLEAIFDDDENKNAKKYSGIAPCVMSSKLLKKEYKIIITSTDYTDQIISKIPIQNEIVGLLV
jgi:hypothetical protein